MRAAVLRDVNELRLEELQDPKPAADEVLVRVKACGVCATDVNMWRGTNTEGTFPFVLGHEWAGEIVETGSEVGAYAVGDRVVGEVAMPCRVCPNCKDGLPPVACMYAKYYGFSWQTPGGMAEYHAAKVERLHKIPDNLSYEEAALVEPISVGYHGVWDSGGGVKHHDRVVIFGGGPIGLLTMLVCKAAGAPVTVVEPHPHRRDMAQELGADAAIDPTDGSLVEQVMAHTANRGASLVIECSGNEAARAATLDVVAFKGRIVLIGIRAKSRVPLELDKLIFKEATIAGSDGSGFVFAKPLELMSRRVVDFAKVITHRFPLDQVNRALELGAGQAESSKILIVP
jgi:L-iditol 2-dehydrogenase